MGVSYRLPSDYSHCLVVLISLFSSGSSSAWSYCSSTLPCACPSCCAVLGKWLNKPGDEWAVKSSCQHRQAPPASREAPYVIATSVTVFPLMKSLCFLTALCCFFSHFCRFFPLFLPGKKHPRFKRGSGFSLCTRVAFVELYYLGKADFCVCVCEVVNHELKMRLGFCSRWRRITKGWMVSHFHTSLPSRPTAFHKS